MECPSKRLGNTHSNSGFTSTGFSGQKNDSSSNLSFLNHFSNNTSRLQVSNFDFGAHTLRALVWPTNPWDTSLASKQSSKPRPRIWEWAPIRSTCVISFISCVLVSISYLSKSKRVTYHSFVCFGDLKLEKSGEILELLKLVLSG